MCACNKKGYEYYETPVFLPGPGIEIPATVPLTLCLPFSAARGTAFGLLGETFSAKELLLSRSKCERYTAIGAVKGLVLKTHEATSSPRIFGRSLVTQYLR